MHAATHLLNAELARVDEVEDGREALKARALDPRRLWQVQRPSLPDGVDEQEKEDRGDGHLDGLEQVDLPHTRVT